MIDILIPALVMSLILLGIHSYFGIRIIGRNIIFTDLAIGQMAALGAAVSLFFLDGAYHYAVSAAFALMTGFLIFYGSRRTRYLEAVIGLIYALGISGVFMLLSKSPHGMEEFQKLMAYDILFTRTEEIAATGALYAVMGAFVYFVIEKTRGAVQEVLFFSAFAVTVTSSVRAAGVLVVFAILLAPSFIALKLSAFPRAPGIVRRTPIVVSWSIGAVINAVAITASYRWDLPTGYAIVFCNAFVAVAVSLIVPDRQVPADDNGV